jgi:hypothetical protein
MSVSQVIFTPIVMFIEKIGPHPTSPDTAPPPMMGLAMPYGMRLQTCHTIQESFGANTRPSVLDPPCRLGGLQR